MAYWVNKSIRLLKINSSFYIFLVLIFAIPLLATVQFFYSIAVNSEKSGIIAYIETTFADHKVVANPYHLAQAISNLESIGSLRCSRLYQTNLHQEDFLYLDLRYKYDCKSSWIYLDGQRFNASFVAVNGDIWKLDAFVVTTLFTKTVFWTFRFLAVFFSFIIILSFKIISQQKDIAHRKELDIQNLKHQKYIEITQITQDISHDLKGPINVLSKVIEATSWDEIKSSLAFYRSAIFRLQTMVSSLKDADVDTLIKERWTEFSLSRIISELQLAYAATKIKLHENLHTKIKIDVTKIERSIANIIINSVEAGAKNIDCIMEIVEDLFVIKVFDDGRGIPVEIRDKIFERGFTSGKKSGSGLGLSSSLVAVRGHGGDIAYSRENGKSIFTITIPGVVSIQSDQNESYLLEFNNKSSRSDFAQTGSRTTENRKMALIYITDKERQKSIIAALGKIAAVNELSKIDYCDLVFTDDLLLAEQCLQKDKHILFDSSSSVEEVVYKIHHELRKV